MLFGTAGIPHRAKGKDIFYAIDVLKNLNLDGMEVEFVYGCWMKEELARKLKDYVRKKKIFLTVHAPYYINLLSSDKKKLENSINRIIKSSKLAFLMGAKSLVFHPGWYGKLDKNQAYQRIKNVLKNIVEELENRGIKIIIRPETMEVKSKFGSLEEVINLTLDLDYKILPCIDFAHLRYRYNRNDEEFYRYVLEQIENKLGKEVLKNMHIHISGIKLDKWGTHLNLDESDIKWKTILDLLKEFNADGYIISESPNLEEDAIKMKKYYYS